MTLTDVNVTGTGFDPATLRPASPVAAPSVAPYAARAGLADLLRLHAEAGANLRLSRFLAQSAPACMILMLAGMAALLVTALGGGGSLKADFAWAVMLLLGITAMVRTYIRGFARSLRRVPLHEAASDLRILFLYNGVVWSSGAFLLMPESPAPALAFAFAALPSLALALCLKDARVVAFFTVPVTVTTAGAALLGAWPQGIWTVSVLVMTGAAITAFSAVQQAAQKKTQALLPSH